jgi:drug/metabolite transporter (DMT)-like permease
MWAVMAALASALLVAVASVLQHRAGLASAKATLKVVLRHRLWLMGAAAGVAGFVFHVLALASGSLSLVQPLLVTGLLFALPLSWLLEHRSVRLPDVAAAVAVVGGLVIFQLAAEAGVGRSSANLTSLAWCTGTVLAIVGLALATAIRRPRYRASWLGLCAGAAYGLLAGLLKASVGLLGGHGAGVLTTWPLYVFVVVVVGAIVVNQLAFNAGPLAASLPLVTIVDPIISVWVGAVAFGESTSSQPVLVAGQVAGFALMSFGVVALSRRASVEQPSAWTANDRGKRVAPERAQAPARTIEATNATRTPVGT